MNDHKGMRPQDILILLKIVALQRKAWRSALFKIVPHIIKNKELADSLKISGAEISASLNRSVFAGLYNPDSKTVFYKSLFEFLQFGLKYVFPTQPGPLTRGVPTAHSAAPLKDLISYQEEIVWEHSEGTVRGQAIVPLYPTVPLAIANDELLYELLALTDALRIGNAREKDLARQELEKRLFS